MLLTNIIIIIIVLLYSHLHLGSEQVTQTITTSLYICYYPGHFTILSDVDTIVTNVISDVSAVVFLGQTFNLHVLRVEHIC